VLCRVAFNSRNFFMNFNLFLLSFIFLDKAGGAERQAEADCQDMAENEE